MRPIFAGYIDNILASIERNSIRYIVTITPFTEVAQINYGFNIPSRWIDNDNLIVFPNVGPNISIYEL